MAMVKALIHSLSQGYTKLSADLCRQLAATSSIIKLILCPELFSTVLLTGIF